jgi:hypothetical protein
MEIVFIDNVADGFKTEAVIRKRTQIQSESKLGYVKNVLN